MVYYVFLCVVVDVSRDFMLIINIFHVDNKYMVMKGGCCNNHPS